MRFSTIADRAWSSANSVMVKLCNDRLAEAVDLQLQCKHACWNTTEPDVLSYRDLFGQLAREVEDYCDQIAERAVEIGGVANSTARVVVTWSHLLCSFDALSRNHAEIIASALASFGDRTAQAIDVSNQFNDRVSANMFRQISLSIEEWLEELAALSTGDIDPSYA